MAKLSKRLKKFASEFDSAKEYDLGEALAKLKEYPLKFDQTVDIVYVLNVDPKYQDQNIR